ncbi:MAG: hypothetical protein KDA75_11745 [Planctomycetaceae bacterium]|nr:hypothetical protein [Planctomycetaceae bacterium]
MLLVVALPLLTTRPLITSLNQSIIVGPQPAATVPLFNVWTIWWNANRLSHGLADYWQAPIFHPTAGTFAFSESQPTTWLVAPLVWLASPLTAYNVYLLGSLSLNGWFGYRLLRQLDCADLIAMAGGVMVLLLPFVFWQIAVLQLIPLWGVLWTLLTLDQLAEAPSLKRGLALGLAFGATYALCNYYGLFLSVLLAVCAPCLLGRSWLSWRTWGAIGVSLVVAALLTAPIVWTQLHYLMQHQFQRPAATVDRLAASWRDYLIPYGEAWCSPADWFGVLPGRWQLSPGTIKIGLAAFGLLVGLFSSGHRRRTFFWGLFLISSLLLASATKVGAGEWNLQSLLVEHWPGFAQIRTPYRFAVFAQLATVVLAALGLQSIYRWLIRSTTPRTAFGLTALLTLAATTDVLPRVPHRTDVPEIADADHWAFWLRDHSSPDAVVTSIPFVAGTSERDHEVTATAMFYQTVHHRPLVEGYSGFFPQPFRDLRKLMETFPDRESIDRLRSHNVRYCIVDRIRLSPDQREYRDGWSDQLLLRYADEDRQVDVYELQPAAN